MITVKNQKEQRRVLKDNSSVNWMYIVHERLYFGDWAVNMVTIF